LGVVVHVSSTTIYIILERLAEETIHSRRGDARQQEIKSKPLAPLAEEALLVGMMISDGI
jgi:hypothetical protein